jgi:uncharacterized protein
MVLRTTERDDGVVFSVKVVPGGSRRRLAGVLGDALKVNLTAPPEKGRANKELIVFLSELLDCSSRDLKIISGPQNAHKEVFVQNFTSNQLLQRLKPFLI